jgi:hypothetical protein
VRAPASFCGTLGFRPSHGTVSVVGVTPMAQSLDTAGKRVLSLIPVSLNRHLVFNAKYWILTSTYCVVSTWLVYRRSYIYTNLDFFEGNKMDRTIHFNTWKELMLVLLKLLTLS